MAKFLSEITFKRSFETYTETSVHKLLLPFEYAKAFCDFINPQGTLDFADFFEEIHVLYLLFVLDTVISTRMILKPKWNI